MPESAESAVELKALCPCITVSQSQLVHRNFLPLITDQMPYQPAVNLTGLPLYLLLVVKNMGRVTDRTESVTM